MQDKEYPPVVSFFGSVVEVVTDQLEKCLVEDLAREDMAPMDTARSMQVLLDKGIRKNFLAKRLGRGPTWIRKVVDLLDPELAEKTERAGVGLKSLSIEDRRRLRNGEGQPSAESPIQGEGEPILEGRTHGEVGHRGRWV